jgi:hypothetical protein
VGVHREFTRSAVRGVALVSSGPCRMPTAGGASGAGEQPQSFDGCLTERHPAPGVDRALALAAAGDLSGYPLGESTVRYHFEQPAGHRDADSHQALGLAAQLGLGLGIPFRFPAAIGGRGQVRPRFGGGVRLVRPGRKPVGFVSPADLQPAQRLQIPTRASQGDRSGSHWQSATGRVVGAAAGRGWRGDLPPVQKAAGADLHGRDCGRTCRAARRCGAVRA